jgi:hypothetical protein
MTALFFYLVGFVNGVLALFFFTIYLGKRSMDRKRKDSTSSKKDSLYKRMDRVKEIAAEMVDLAMRVEQPQKNSLDGKYKNNLNARFKALEEEKNDILKSILADGFDPELTTVDSSGVVSKMKLSEYMDYVGISAAPKPKTPGEVKAERMGKFTVFKGGKDDNGGDTTH